jgi:hypothetical protein
MQVIPKHSKLPYGAQQVAGRSKRTGRQAAERTCADAAPYFLRHSFLPLCSVSQKALPYNQEQETTYIQSLEKLTACYGIEAPEISAKPYPYNLLYSHWDAERKLRKLNPDLRLEVVMEKGKILLATEDRLNTDHQVFYIPVKPLYLLSESRVQQQRKAYAILLSVCAYLYHKAQVSYYRSVESYIYWQYEMLEEYLADCEDDWEGQSFLDNCKAISEAKRYGDIMERKIYDYSNIRYFKQRLDSFAPASKWDRECLAIGRECYGLLEQYPDANLYSHIQHIKKDFNEDEEDDDEDENYIYPEQYVSFVATTEDWLGETLIRTVSDELNNCWCIQEPTVKLLFDEKRESIDDSISYERRLFDLIGDLYNLLNQIR